MLANIPDVQKPIDPYAGNRQTLPKNIAALTAEETNSD
jgi:hypothetical protein